MPDYVLIIVAFFSVLGFSILFNIPSKNIFMSAVCGAVGWATYWVVMKTAHSPIVGSLMGAFVAGILGEYFAVKNRRPATVFIIPAILPLVPGYGLYNTMFNAIQKNYATAGNIGIEALMIALSIALGLIFSSSATKLVRSIQRNQSIQLKK